MAARTTFSHGMNVQEQSPNVPAYHPYLNAKNHAKLLQYCKERIEVARDFQANMLTRYEEIDKEFYGYLNLSPEDLQRRIKQFEGKSTSPTEMRAAFIAAQMWRMVTFFVSVFSPDSGIYEIVTDKSNQSLGQALTTLMNNHAIKGRYFTEQAQFFLQCLKYNIGSFTVDWFIKNGKKLKNQGGRTKTENTTLFEGNCIECLDMYNTFWEPLCDPLDVHLKAEYAGFVKLVTRYQLKKAVEDGEIFNTANIWQQPSSMARTDAYYRRHPEIRTDMPGTTTGGIYDWTNILSMGLKNSNTTVSFEETTLFIRLIPGEFGLAPRNNKSIELWRIKIINGDYIVQTKKMINVHDYLPMFFGRPMQDNLENQVKSPVETLSPFQTFANFLLNTHIQGTRENLYGVTIYDPSVVNLAAIKNDVAAKVPANPGAQGRDLRQSIYKLDSNVDTKQTMEQLDKVLDLMEYIFPTRLLQQVGNIDRAIGEQIAALLAAAYRDSWKLARTLDEQAMSPMRFVLVSNIKQFQTEMEVPTPNGKVPISPMLLQNTDFEFKIGEGLKMIDRLTLATALGEVINRILQSQALAEFDVPGLVNFYSSLWGSETDLTQFRRAPAQVAATQGQPGATGGQQLAGQPPANTLPAE